MTERSNCESAAVLAGMAGSNPAVKHGRLSSVNVVCCQVEVSATGRSLSQRSPTERCVSEWSVIRRNSDTLQLQWGRWRGSD